MADFLNEDFTEPHRLAALHAFGAMDTADNPAFTRIVNLASRAADAPMAAISFLDANRCWNAAFVGALQRDVDRNQALCNLTIQQSDVLIIPDTSQDSRVTGSLAATGRPRPRFYAGAPITTRDGARLGSVSIMDHVPRLGLSESERDTLVDLAALAMLALESRRQTRLDGLDTEEAHAAHYLNLIATAANGRDALAAVLRDGVAMFGAHAARLWQVTPNLHFDELSFFTREGMPQSSGAALANQSGTGSIAMATALGGKARCVDRATLDQPDEPLAALMQAEHTDCAVVVPTVIGETRFALIATFAAPCSDIAAATGEVTRLVESLGPSMQAEEPGAAPIDPPGPDTAPAIDLATRRAHERDMRERDASFRLMFEDNPLPMLLYDVETLAITQVNDAVIRSYGYPHADFIRLSVLDLFLEEDRPDVLAVIARLDDQPADNAWTNVRANGERIEVQIVTRPITFAARRHRMAVIWDVTEIEYARDALRQSNQELLVLAGELQARTADLTEVNRRARLGMWRMPPDGGAAEWSDEMFEIFGRPAAQPGPDLQTLLDWVAPADRARVADAVAHVGEQRAAHSFEFRAVQPGGAIRHCLADLRPDFGFGTQLLALKGFCQDVTERKETELALLRSEKLKTIGQFTGGVAHDFNNLLTVMMLNVEEAIDSLDPENPLQPLLGPVLHAAMRGSELTSQLLSYARRSPLEPMHISLHDLFDGLNPLLDRVLGDRFSLEVHYGDAGVKPFADAAKLENAVLNLVINARDAMSTGGKIVITTSVARLGPHDDAHWTDFVPGQYALISVSDTGCGIPADVFPRVFEPFFTTKAVGKGSGLGLSMVYGFAKQSGGHVTIASDVAVGTTATLYLPLHGAQAEVPLRAQKTASRAIAPQMAALLVEDQPDVLETLQRQLLGHGFKVIVAADATSAMDHVTGDATLDLLFTDVAIPGPIDGIQLAAIARQRHPGIRVMLTSGYLDYESSHAADLPDGTEFLQKPYNRVELAERLAAMFPLPLETL